MVAFLVAFVAFFSLLLGGVGVAMARRKLPPNPWSGIRVERTLADPEVWYAVHEKAGPGWVATAAVGVLVFAVAMPVFGAAVALNAWGAVMVFGVVIASMRSLRAVP